jgi:hypothetical protein
MHGCRSVAIIGCRATSPQRRFTPGASLVRLDLGSRLLPSHRHGRLRLDICAATARAFAQRQISVEARDAGHR